MGKRCRLVRDQVVRGAAVPFRVLAELLLLLIAQGKYFSEQECGYLKSMVGQPIEMTMQGEHFTEQECGLSNQQDSSSPCKIAVPMHIITI